MSELPSSPITSEQSGWTEINKQFSELNEHPTDREKLMKTRVLIQLLTEGPMKQTMMARWIATANICYRKTCDKKAQEYAIHQRELAIVFPDVPIEQRAQMLVSNAFSLEYTHLYKQKEELLTLETSLLELQHLFKDLQILVDSQQEGLDSIEANVNQAVAYTEEGTQNMTQAVKWDRKVSNKIRACCGFLVIIVFLIFIVPVLKQYY